MIEARALGLGHLGAHREKSFRHAGRSRRYHAPALESSIVKPIFSTTW